MPSAPTSRFLTATLAFHDAANSVWDVAVVGAGPAGALAARQAALLGASVLLIDKAAFPRWKVCGCCLNAAAVEALASVGLGDLPARLGARPLTKIRFAAGMRIADCPLPGGVSLSREGLDYELIRAAIAAGASFLPETEASIPAQPECLPEQSSANGDSDLISQTKAARFLQLRQGTQIAEIRARVVLAADGLSSRIVHGVKEIAMRVADDSRLGAGTVLDEAPAFYESGTIHMATSHGGYVGLVRLEDGRLDVAAAFDRAAVRKHGGPGALAAAILRDAGFPPPLRLEDSTWRGTSPLTRRPARLWAARLLALGDAAGYIEPFTGEGIAWALAGARAVAPLAVAGATAWDERIGREWERQHRQIIGTRQHICGWVRRLLRRPQLCAAAVRVLQIMPQFASPLVATINRPFERPNFNRMFDEAKQPADAK